MLSDEASRAAASLNEQQESWKSSSGSSAVLDRKAAATAAKNAEREAAEALLPEAEVWRGVRVSVRRLMPGCSAARGG